MTQSKFASYGNTKHGMRHTRFYEVWKGMKNRCSNKSHRWYKNYGGRGIKVCKRWMTFENFRDDMFLSYSPGLTLDRINNDGNYEPSNCKWITRKKQMNNMRRNIFISYKGRKQTLAEWATELEIPYLPLYQDLYRKKISFKEAIKKYEK